MSSSRELLVGARMGDFPSFHIDPIELNDQVETHGVGCTLRRAVYCPCVRPETLQPRTGCPHCRGLRYVYPKDLEEPIIALIVNRSPKRELRMAGEVTTGDAWATLPLGIVPGTGDQLLPSEEAHVINETLWRRQQQIDNQAMRHRASARITSSSEVTGGSDDQLPPKMLPGSEKLLYPTATDVEYIHWLDDDGKLIRALRGEYEVVGSEIRWRKDQGPEDGHPYTVRYTAPAAYMILTGEPVYRQESVEGLGFPYRTQIRRLDRWGDPDLRD